MDALRSPPGLELGAAIRDHVATGLLGAHRIGLRTRRVAAEGQSERATGRSRGSGDDPADAGDFDDQDAPAQMEGRSGRSGLGLRPTAGSCFRRLALPFTRPSAGSRFSMTIMAEP